MDAGLGLECCLFPNNILKMMKALNKRRAREKVGGETGGRGWRDAWSSACCALELHLASVASKPCLF